ncbi:hypothetical protein AB9P05_04100 [Roseivirga sp. BDSF3-8]|uniref:hypothetical protein n=1 Tax=Roseivirga sp. BDSF3-8 TaxID=3241598 RepID=UPI00353223E0
MLEYTPLWLDIFFILTVLATVFIFYLANGQKTGLLILTLGWAGLHSVLSLMGVYQNMNVLPPPFTFPLIGAALLIIIGLAGRKSRKMAREKNLVTSTVMHTVRIPVEVTLYALFLYGAVPEIMTFGGRNYDILSGLTAPLVAWLLSRKLAKPIFMIFWNIICLGLVLFILVHGVLSTELPIQQFGFDQPNRAVLYFPYVLLPAVVVPIVIYSHLSDLMVYLRAYRRRRSYKGVV